eukprot:GFYU01002458.1.p1 GENE.GFYU01002458.1~~GFYU01002458.1.p1  ORF type:complete len:332 (+),score=46.41 GFYU01002458.1:115-996(+)
MMRLLPMFSRQPSALSLGIMDAIAVSPFTRMNPGAPYSINAKSASPLSRLQSLLEDIESTFDTEFFAAPAKTPPNSPTPHRRPVGPCPAVGRSPVNQRINETSMNANTTETSASEVPRQPALHPLSSGSRIPRPHTTDRQSLDTEWMNWTSIGDDAAAAAATTEAIATAQPERQVAGGAGEGTDAFQLSISCPGVLPKDIKVTVTDIPQSSSKLLSVSGMKTEEKEDKENGIYSKRTSQFSRRFVIPAYVDASQLATKFRQKNLVITAPSAATPPCTDASGEGEHDVVNVQAA